MAHVSCFAMSSTLQNCCSSSTEKTLKPERKKKNHYLTQGCQERFALMSKYTFLSFIDSFTGTNEVSTVRGNCLNSLDNREDHFLHLSSQYYEKA